VKPVDVLIVGAGPAGLGTAIAASRNGLRVAVLDGRRPPIDKTCGEGLLPSALAALASLGVTVTPGLGIPFTGIRFSDERSSAYAPLSGACGIGLRRRELHRLLIERAETCGVSLFWGACISAMESTGVWVNGERHPCRWLIGADGQRSAVRKFAGLDPHNACRPRFGFRRHFAVAPWSGAVEVLWGERVQVIVTPTGAMETCVVVLTSDPHMRVEQAIESFPAIANRLRRAQVLSKESGTTTCLSRARAVLRGNVALVGDASCAIDGISGHGLSLAFQEGIALADALAREKTAEYVKSHARITKVPVRMTRLLLVMDASATLRRSVLRCLARTPTLFARLISLHAGCATVQAYGQVGLETGCHANGFECRV
jgi:menaquinone-9 beta-reductase